MVEGLEIKDVNLENLGDLINLCIPPERRDDPLFIKGARVKRRWTVKALEKYGSIAKLAYLGSKPVGLIQYKPNIEERIVEISCIFVPERENLRKGIGSSLLKALIEDMRRPKPYFGGRPPDALLARAFEVPGLYPQHKFYQRRGFKNVKKDNPFLLYYPLKEGYVYRPREKRTEYIPQEEDMGKALIFHSSSCPFSVYFAEKTRELIKKVIPEIPVRIINKFEEPEEVKKRGDVPFCVVNGRQIKSFFMDKENFQREVKEALEQT
jgi:GNAT superfamily N-acetyltransferase